MTGNSVVSGRTQLKFELIQAFMHCIVSYKNEDDQIHKEGARVFTTLYIDFSDVQGQLTL